MPVNQTVSSSGQILVCFILSKLINAAAVLILVCPCVNVSCGMKLNLDYLLEQLWEYLALICIYTKKRGGIFFCFTSTHQNTTEEDEGRKKRENNAQSRFLV